MLGSEIGGRWGKEYYVMEEGRSSRSVSEIGIRKYYYKILCDVVPSGRCAIIHSVLWLLWGVYWVY